MFSRWFVDNKTTNTIINTNGNIISTTEKFYDNVSHKLPTRQFVTNSKGETIITTTKYAHELNNSRLISENRIAEPLQVEVSKKVGSTTTKLSTQNTTYKDYGNGIYKPHIVKASKGTAALEDRVIYHTYTGKGNPKEISKKNDAKIYYVWGYEGSMPIAEIKGYTSINSAQLAAINDAISASNSDVSSSTEDQLRTKLTALRNAFASTTAQVTTYTYDRLLGLTSVTDARGYTMFYVYDDFNRLKQVKDKNGNILEENQYRYKN